MLHITSNVFVIFLHIHVQHIIEPAEIWVWWARLAKRCKLCSNAMDTFASFA